MSRILVGLSGGVDSSVAAALLLEQGHEVVGAYMKNWINEDEITGHCPWMEDIKDAQKVAEQLGIEFRVVNLMQEYKNRVVHYLLEGYDSGITPNPDVLCNREMKFGVFANYAKQEGFTAVATGHYARRIESSEGARVLRGKDSNKDQSYFLSLMQQPQAQIARFPVGELNKADVRAHAEKLGLCTANKKDSQGICFIGKIKMTDFLANYLADDPGEIITTTGKKVGEHRGLHHFTLGQRKGHGIASPKEGVAFVVVGKNQAEKQLIVGYEDQNTPGLYSQKCQLEQISWICPDPPENGSTTTLLAQPRYRSPAPSATLELSADGNSATLHYSAPQRALTPGQICALYREHPQGQELLGGAIFSTIYPQ